VPTVLLLCTKLPCKARCPPPLLPTCGAGFNHFTACPKIIAADKTQYIEALDKDSEYQYLFLRPRRCGKSTFLQTLASYYDKSMSGEFEDIFRDLYIGRNRTAAASSLVLCFDFSRISVLNSTEFTVQLFNDNINETPRHFLVKNWNFLQPFDLEALLVKLNAAISLTKVLVCLKYCLLFYFHAKPCYRE